MLLSLIHIFSVFSMRVHQRKTRKWWIYRSGWSMPFRHKNWRAACFLSQCANRHVAETMLSFVPCDFVMLCFRDSAIVFSTDMIDFKEQRICIKFFFQTEQKCCGNPYYTGRLERVSPFCCKMCIRDSLIAGLGQYSIRPGDSWERPRCILR